MLLMDGRSCYEHFCFPLLEVLTPLLVLKHTSYNALSVWRVAVNFAGCPGVPPRQLRRSQIPPRQQERQAGDSAPKAWEV